MPRRPVPCRQCGKPCHLGPGSRPDPMCMDCIRSSPTYQGRHRSSPLRMITCEICGQTALATMNRDTGERRQKTCLSDECRKEAKRRKSRRYRITDRGIETQARAGRGSCQIWVRDCAECRRIFVARRPKQVCCGDECRRKRQSRMVSQGIVRRYREDPEFRDRMIAKVQNRRAKKLGVGSITSPATLLAYLMERDKGRCQIPDCQHSTRRIQAKRGPWRPSIDHIVPLSRGGQHELANLQLAHYRCNLAKHNSGGGEQLLLVG